MQSPCVSCSHELEDKDDRLGESVCADTCIDLRLFQKALTVCAAIGPAPEGLCLICRSKSEKLFCDYCRDRIGVISPPKKIMTLTEKTSIRCECGRMGSKEFQGYCRTCYTYKVLLNKPEIKRKSIAGRVLYRPIMKKGRDGMCEICLKIIEKKSTCVTRKTLGIYLYAHIECAKKELR